MKCFNRQPKSRSKKFIGLLLTQFAIAASIDAQPRAIFDNGVDPANLGRGDWIYKLEKATNQLNGLVPSVTNISSLMS
jgi:hypothetical protein